MIFQFGSEKNKKKTARPIKQLSMMSKVFNQFGLKVENSKIIPVTELKRKQEIAQQGWKKVRNALGAVRFAKNINLLIGNHRKCSYQTFLIYPQSKLKAALNILESLIIIYNIIIVPYRFFSHYKCLFRYAFDKVYNKIFILMDIICDSFYILVIMAHFFFVKTKKTEYVTNFKDIAVRYLMQAMKNQFQRGFVKLDQDGLFLIDLASIFPYYYYEQLYWLRFFRFFQLSVAVKGYILLWRKLIRLFTSNLNFTRSMTDILRFLLFLFLLAQCLACLWYFLGDQQQDVLEGNFEGKPVYLDGWVKDILYVKDPNANQYTEYITSLYWVFTTLTTVGYGDYHGSTTYELVFTMMVEFIGVFVFAYMMGNINMLVEKLDDNHLEYLESQNEQLDEWLIKIGRANENRRLGGIFIEELRHRLNLYWQQDHSSMSTLPFFRQLPFKMQSELIDFCFGEFIANFSSFFRGLEVPFMHQIVTSLYPKQFLVKNGECNIIRAGSTAEELYFITKGKVAISTTVGEKFLLLPPFSYFGDYLIMFNLKSSNYFSTFNEDIECMCISKERFLQICSIYPYSQKLLQYKAFARRKYIQTVKSNYSKMREEHKIKLGTLIFRRSQIPDQQKDEIQEIYAKVEDEEIIKFSRVLWCKIEDLKATIAGMEKQMREKISQIKMEIEYVTKYEEIAANLGKAEQ